jgi:hypothetical protein
MPEVWSQNDPGGLLSPPVAPEEKGREGSKEVKGKQAQSLLPILSTNKAPGEASVSLSTRLENS